jgi:DMSO/TMAO reductase YedYZ molybdopterin-dependent catalytic subunit
MKSTRRNFFFLAAGGALMAQDRGGMRVLSTRPEDLEMELPGFSDYLTAPEHFFVRTHVYAPTSVDMNEWRLKIDGLVGTPQTLTLDDLKKMPATELVAVVECAGNGRGYFEPHVPGLQWTNGSVANARWRGVRLADVLKHAGIKESATEILFNGVDEPLGKMQDFRRTITAKKALDPNTLLAWEMNGQPVPIKHGFPLRLIAPGWASDSWTKWVTQITVLDKEFDGFWMKNAYRKPDHAVAPMTALTPDQMQPVTSLKVKSAIYAPLDGAVVSPGQAVSIRGVAWSGDKGPVTAVDVSTDGGRAWKPATLHRDQATQFGWRQWEFSWKPEREAYYTVFARARDASGAIQPFAQEWNPSGYGWNVVSQTHVNVTTSAAPAPPPTAAPAFNAPPDFAQTCLACHRENVITQQHLTRGQWDRELTKMSNWGAPLKPQDRETFLDFLEKNFPQQ